MQMDTDDVIAIRGSDFEFSDAVILGDSICSKLTHVSKCDLRSYKGCTIERLKDKLKFIDLKQYKCVVLIIGTNNLSDKEVWFDYLNQVKDKIPNPVLKEHQCNPVIPIVEKYHDLIIAIRKKNPDIYVISVPILPRVFDFDQNRNHLIEVNNRIECMLSECFLSYSFVPIYKQFMHKGRPVKDYQCEDGLHPSEKGINLLRDILNREVGVALKTLI